MPGAWLCINSHASGAVLTLLPRTLCDTPLQTCLKDGYLHNGAHPMPDDAPIQPGAQLVACCHVRGGKGGYGNMLRSLGRKHGLADNTGDCRSLDGRRMRDVEAAQQAAEWAASAAERAEAKAQEKKERDAAKAELRQAEEKVCDGTTASCAPGARLAGGLFPMLLLTIHIQWLAACSIAAAVCRRSRNRPWRRFSSTPRTPATRCMWA